MSFQEEDLNVCLYNNPNPQNAKSHTWALWRRLLITRKLRSPSSIWCAPAQGWRLHEGRPLSQPALRSQPFMEHPYNRCAVVGNGGILNKSLCGAEIDKSDFVFRCNLPPITGNVSKDVGSKTNVVTVNPSIIKLKYGNLKKKKEIFLEDIATYGDAFLLLPAFSFRANTIASFKVYNTLKEAHARQKVLFFHPKYLRNLALFWRTEGVTEFRLSSGLMITSVAVELCEHVKLYGFWPFSRTVKDTPVSHHYYDNNLPKRGFHEMPKEYRQILQLHLKGILKLQFSKCEIAQA
uniref:alpha-2,8-sialyltransferase 8F n=1 Tax=Panthera onca TaxID=9690 RepID=UPI00295384C8|nr:alpha-2,8-sialyltransferase 8F [Panthera onca]